jgi:hypothetical protein
MTSSSSSSPKLRTAGGEALGAVIVLSDRGRADVGAGGLRRFSVFPSLRRQVERVCAKASHP